MQEIYKQLLTEIGEDIYREGIVDTPRRAAKAMEYLTKGYQENLDDILNNALFASDVNEMVVVKNIELYSLCEHHLLPFFGKCHVGYFPNGKVIGLSKIPRIVDVFARRLQIQERLTSEIAQTIEKITGSTGVAVVIEAQHLCTMMRGVEKQSPTMKTSVMLGEMKHNQSSRLEFLKFIEH